MVTGLPVTRHLTNAVRHGQLTPGLNNSAEWLKLLTLAEVERLSKMLADLRSKDQSLP